MRDFALPPSSHIIPYLPPSLPRHTNVHDMEGVLRAGAAPEAPPHVPPPTAKPEHEARLPFEYADETDASPPATASAAELRTAAAAAADAALTRHAPAAGSPAHAPVAPPPGAVDISSCDGSALAAAFEFGTVDEHLFPQHTAGAISSRAVRGGAPSTMGAHAGETACASASATDSSVATARSGSDTGVVAAPKLSSSALRARIRAIGADPALSSEDQDRARQRLYSSAYSEQQRAASQAYQARMKARKFEQSWSVHVDPASGARLPGCEHYARNCKILAPCCGIWAVCRHCHNAPAVTAEHEIDRFAVERVMCMLCWTEQDVGAVCVNDACGARFAQYFCGKCRFYDNTPGKEIYHCDKCAICRVGRDNHHCDKCNACVSLGDGKDGGHRCLKSSLDANCPICSGYMLTSTAQVVFMQCGHAMHSTCFEEYTNHNYVCPICSKSLTDMSPYYETIDEVVAEQQLPEQYAHRKLEVLCHDCDVRSVTAFHFLYHKCVRCSGYNTRLVGDRGDDEQIRVLPDKGVSRNTAAEHENER